MRSAARLALALSATVLAAGARVLTGRPAVASSGPRRPAKRTPGNVYIGGILRPNTAPGANARKRKIPSKRKTRVRLRAHLEGRELDRPLTAHERSWL